MDITAKLGIAAMVIGAFLIIHRTGDGLGTWILIAAVVALLISADRTRP